MSTNTVNAPQKAQTTSVEDRLRAAIAKSVQDRLRAAKSA